MKPVKPTPRYRCDYCSKTSTHFYMARHEQACYGNPNRVCRECGHVGRPERQQFDQWGTPSCFSCASYDKTRWSSL